MLRKITPVTQRLAVTSIATVAAFAALLVNGASVSLAVNAEKYYEDSNSNICVGLPFAGGFAAPSCEWGSHITGKYNTGLGDHVLNVITSGEKNTAIGEGALESDTTGYNNTAVGHGVLYHSETGINNTAIGEFALCCGTGMNNTAVGQHTGFDLTSGAENLMLGKEAGENLTTGSNNIDLENQAESGDTDTIRIGTEGTQNRAFVAGIDKTEVKGCTVQVTSEGQLGCNPAVGKGLKICVQEKAGGSIKLPPCKKGYRETEVTEL